MRSITIGFALALLVQSAGAQATSPDSASHPTRPRRSVVRPWEAVAFGGLTVGAVLLDQAVRNEAQHTRGGGSDVLADVANIMGEKLVIVPALAVGTLAGHLFHARGLKGLSLRAAEATALAGNSVMLIKVIVGRRRPLAAPDNALDFKPFSFHDNSFPSGHTAVAFALATSLASETRNPVLRTALYGMAGLTAVARINDDKHWLSDTVVGAAFGIIATRLVRRWQHPIVVGPGRIAMRISF